MGIGIADPFARGTRLRLHNRIVHLVLCLDLDDQFLGFGLNHEIGFVGLATGILDPELTRPRLHPADHVRLIRALDDDGELPLFIGIEPLIRPERTKCPDFTDKRTKWEQAGATLELKQHVGPLPQSAAARAAMTGNMCFPSGYLAPKRMVERPKPAPSGKDGRFVRDSSHNCQIRAISLVLAESHGMMPQPLIRVEHFVTVR